ncbi:YALIA101S04e04896g1_1 [Yarrowia lipolytica]|jgi:NAD(P)H dehydrogenase (quinone)|nr:Protoplast secreted protein 2 [Yarrowia lipolytica]SEI33891.1 YALIA101S04e04896g1_1 [Yarrowia lipolytica]VBB89189.1 Protein with similarity to a family of flavodoxin-like proteins, putative [Yarrowia lipolytica]
MPKIAILIYSTYGHIAELARKEAEGVKAAGGQVDLYQVEETLSEEILKYMKAPGQPHDFKVLTPADVEVLTGYDGFLFGIPSRFGSFPAQWKTFWDATGGLWATGGLHGKYVGQFVSSGTQGGGQEVLPRNTLSIYVHHGMNYVPLGYKDTFAEQTNLEEVHGGSPWGAGTFADSDGSRTPSPLEEKVAFTQGKVFTEVLIKAEGGAAGATNGVQNGAQQKTLDPKAGGATGNDVTGGEAAAAAGVGAGAVGAGAGAVGAGAAPAAGAGAAPPADAATATNTGTTAATGAATTEKGAAGTAGASTGAAANTTTAKPTAAASKPATTEKAAGAKKTNPAKDVKEEKSKCCGICTIM